MNPGGAEKGIWQAWGCMAPSGTAGGNTPASGTGCFIADERGWLLQKAQKLSVLQEALLTDISSSYPGLRRGAPEPMQEII